MVVSAIVGSLGFWELIKYLLHRRANSRKADSEADAKAYAESQKQACHAREYFFHREEKIFRGLKGSRYCCICVPWNVPLKSLLPMVK